MIRPMSELFHHAAEIMSKGVPVMWVLLGVSIVSLTLTFERVLFWLSLNGSGRRARIDKITEKLRSGDLAGAKNLADQDQSLYGAVAEALLVGRITDSTAIGLVERHRPSLERFNTALSTIVTGSPLVGLLGTVTGIIRSFDLIGNASAVRDIPAVAQGVSEALLNTAGGLGVALFTLIPYVIFKGMADRGLGTIEVMVAAAEQGRAAAPAAKA